MLEVTIPSAELFDDEKQEFFSTKETTIRLEHSLLSISKWESKWKIPFVNSKNLTGEQELDYIRCMTVTPNVDPNVYLCLTNENFQAIKDYIEGDQTATWFNDKNMKKVRPKGTRRIDVVTSEVVYYWMCSYQIPWEAQKWHFSRLIALIRVCNEMNKDPKKMSKRAVMSQNASLNAARRKAMHTHG